MKCMVTGNHHYLHDLSYKYSQIVVRSYTTATDYAIAKYSHSKIFTGKCY